MNLDCWKKQFYYTDTATPVEHAINVFTGLKPINLWVYWLTKYDDSSIIYARPSIRGKKDQNRLMLDITSTYCHLPLNLYQKEYLHWVRIGDPLLMLKVLNKT